jgi:hypothetical protein
MCFRNARVLTVALFDQLVDEVLPWYGEAEERRLSSRQRQRAIGGGHPFELRLRDHVLLTVIWLRLYPIHEVLAYLFGISDSTVSRLIECQHRFEVSANHRDRMSPERRTAGPPTAGGTQVGIGISSSASSCVSAPSSAGLGRPSSPARRFSLRR